MAVMYDSITDTTPGFTLRIGFWQDPDLSGKNPDPSEEEPHPSEETRADYYGDLTKLGQLLNANLGDDLAACGFSDLEVYVVDNYRDLREERRNGRFFDLLHCDQAAYLISGMGEADPYEVLVEEATKERIDEFGAGIWVRRDSPIQRVTGKPYKDLDDRHVAVVDERSLCGGALQMARLARSATPPLPTNKYKRTACGSTSDAILRLITGFASEYPIEAAFLPLESPGFEAARKTLGLGRREDIPIQLLDGYKTDGLPGRPMLVARYLQKACPDLTDRLSSFFENQTSPWQWVRPDLPRYRELGAELVQLPDMRDRKP